MASATAQADVVQCGDPITHSIVVSNDLTCPNSGGITIAADGIIVNLNGHTFDGAGSLNSGNGVDFAGHSNATVTNGRITGFGRDGIAVDGSNNKVQRVTAVSNFFNGIGVRGATGTRIVDSEQSSNNFQGIVIFQSSTTSVTGDTETGSTNGIRMEGGGGGNTVTQSRISGNGNCGFEVDGEANDAISYSTLSSGGSTGGICDMGGVATQITANDVTHQVTGVRLAGQQATARGNRVTSSTGNGFFITGSNNTLRGNTAQVNGGIGILVLFGNANHIIDNIAGSASGTSGHLAEGNFEGIDVGGGGSGNELIGNLANSNNGVWPSGGRGIEVNGAGPTTISGNQTNRNTGDGMTITEDGGPVTGNSARYNQRFGIELFAGIDGGGNHASGNVLGQCAGLVCVP